MAAAGGKILVVEADLRRPLIAELLGADRTVGLTNVLVRRLSRSNAVQHTVSGVDVLASGPLPPNPSDLLGSEAMARLLAEASEEYDVVLIDASPLSPVTDAAALAPRADGVLLVVPYGKADRQQLVRARESLEAVSAPLLGSVMTKVPVARRRRNTGEDAYFAVRPELVIPQGEQPVPASTWTQTPDTDPPTASIPVTPSPRPRSRQPVPDDSNEARPPRRR
jgi:capsular exopolysaccharide synthesis family protein